MKQPTMFEQTTESRNPIDTLRGVSIKRKLDQILKHQQQIEKLKGSIEGLRVNRDYVGEQAAKRQIFQLQQKVVRMNQDVAEKQEAFDALQKLCGPQDG